MSYRNSGAKLGGGVVLHKNENLNDYLRHLMNYNMTLAPCNSSGSFGNKLSLRNKLTKFELK